MKRVLSRVLFTLVLILSLSQIVLTQDNVDSNHISNVQITQNLTSMPLSFTENKGQWDEKIKFRMNSGRATMWLASDGAFYHFTRTIKSDSISIVDERKGIPDDIQPDSIETMMIKANFVGANSSPQMIGIDLMEYKCNYFIGNDESKWRTGVPNYKAVLYEDVYNGINLKYYGHGNQVEYDFIVEPGSDYSQIQIMYDGVISLSIENNKDLVVETVWGSFVEKIPKVYQFYDNEMIPICGGFKVIDSNTFTFDLRGYNPEYTMVIDPVLEFSTYLGGSLADYGMNISVDHSGSAYIIGHTLSTDFPTVSPYQTIYSGFRDIFVSKLDSTGTQVSFSTYIGGSGGEYGRALVLDSLSNVYITGYTRSTDFPIQNPYQSNNDGDYDAFVTKLSSLGDSVVYSTYIGGSDDDYGYDIVLNSKNEAHISGHTESVDFDIINQLPGSSFGGGFLDMFVTKLDSVGNQLLFSTFLGGNDEEFGSRLKVDESDVVYITGSTVSTNFPLKNELYGDQPGRDAFVTKIDGIMDTLIFSTYIGGDHEDRGGDIDFDVWGNTYVSGYTFSDNFPIKSAYQPIKDSLCDMFIIKINSTNDDLVYSTYLGGNNLDYGGDIALSDTDNVCITGESHSSNFPQRGSYLSYKPQHNGIVSILNSSGDDLYYSTYLGGSNNDRGWCIFSDIDNDLYVTGYTNSTDFPLENPLKPILNVGNMDAFVTKIKNIYCCKDYRGNIDNSTDDLIDIADLVYFVDYSFGTPIGSKPPCFFEADIDANNILDIADIVGLVTYMFNNGLQPENCPTF